MIDKQQTIDRVFILSIVISLFLHFINQDRGRAFIAWSIFLTLLFVFHTRAWLFTRETNQRQSLFITSSILIILFSLLRPSFPYAFHSENALRILIEFTHLPINYHPQINDSHILISLTIWVAAIITDLLSVFLIKRKS